MTTNKCIECGSGDAVRGLCEDCREIEYDFDFYEVFMEFIKNASIEECKEIWDLLHSGE